MNDPILLAIDQGTSSSRAIAFTSKGEIIAVEQLEFAQIYPQSGWVEHDPEAIWQTVLSTTRKVIEKLHAMGRTFAAIGITNQRETSIIWDKKTGAPIYNAIVWQDRRTAQKCRQLTKDGHEATVAEKTGLRLDPYFSATKLAWILDHVDGAREKAKLGQLAFGTVDSFLMWRLTGGAHLTDATNASRTALYDIVKGCWDEDLCALFDVPMSGLAQVRDCAGHFGVTDANVLGVSLPICGVAGDQQAALIGQAGFNSGDIKSTFGTGAFLVLNTGAHMLRSSNKLLTTIAYQLEGQVSYALEGSILSAGSTIQWLRDGLGLFSHASEVEALAMSVVDTGGVYLVPAFTGLGAPHWDPEARGIITGLTRATGRAEIVRAGLDSCVYQTHDLVCAMTKDGVRPSVLKVDGGMAKNGFFLQRLADILDIRVVRPKVNETTAYGAACLAGLGCGVYGSPSEFARLWQADVQFDPVAVPNTRQIELGGWHRAVNAAREGRGH